MTTLQLSIPSLSLLIVAKAKMNNGLCYIGFDASSNTLERPLYSAVEHRQCWPRDNDFFVGETITVICSFLGQSSLPHSNEDILVNSVVTRSYPDFVFSPSAIFETLFKLSSPTVGAIFGNENILEYSYVREGTACRSVGIYCCNGESITLREYLYDGNLKRRCIIEESPMEYDFPITAEDSYQQPKNDDSVLLLLGLARPWPKRETIKRCYILVIGMITKPSGSNISQVNQLDQLIN